MYGSRLDSTLHMSWLKIFQMCSDPGIVRINIVLLLQLGERADPRFKWNVTFENWIGFLNSHLLALPLSGAGKSFEKCYWRKVAKVRETAMSENLWLNWAHFLENDNLVIFSLSVQWGNRGRTLNSLFRPNVDFLLKVIISKCFWG